MKALAERDAATRQGSLKRLGDIIGVHMMDGLEPDVRKRQLLAAGELAEHVEINISGRIHGRPAWPGDVAGMRSLDGVPLARPIQRAGTARLAALLIP